MPLASLPLPASELPDVIRRFGDPSAPTPARTMGAKGLVPVKGNELVTLLIQLGHDPDASIAQAARTTLSGLPEGVLLAACEGALHPAILDGLSNLFDDNSEILHRVILNHATDNSTIARIALRCDEKTSEIIATNQQRLLGAPEVIEALYKNRNTRMSTADRLIELAARHGMELHGIPAFRLHVEALQGQLIPEPTAEPLPTDLEFTQALAQDEEDPEAIVRDDVDGSENLKEQFKPLAFRIRDMGPGEKIRLAMVGDAAARAILVRDKNRAVAYAAISSPRMMPNEAANIAHSKEVSEDVLRYIGNKREWLMNYELKRALVFNPKAPIGVALRFIGHLRDADIKSLTRSRNVAPPIKAAANQRIQAKQKKGG